MPLSSDQHIVDQQFKKQLSNYAVRPSSRVWLRIAQSINLQGRSSTRKIILITAGLLLIGSSAGLYESLHHSRSASKEELNPVEMRAVPTVMQTASIMDDHSEALLSKHTDFISQKAVHQYPVNSSEITVSPSVAEENEIQDQLSFRESEATISGLKTSGLNKFQEGTRYPPMANSPGKDEPGKFGAGSYFVGVSAFINNTWLLDQHAVASDNLKYQFTLGAAYGMQGGYYFAKRWGVQTAWILNSWQGQKYKNIDLYGRTTNLDYTEKSISLTYMDIPVLVQYRVPKYSDALKNAYNINLVFGGQYGHLLSYRVDGVKGEINNTHIFNRNEFAAVAGIDYDFMTENTVFYTIGIRTSIGTNIFNSNVPNYFEFSEPHNFIIGLHGAVNFGFSK